MADSEPVHEAHIYRFDEEGVHLWQVEGRKPVTAEDGSEKKKDGNKKTV